MLQYHFVRQTKHSSHLTHLKSLKNTFLPFSWPPRHPQNHRFYLRYSIPKLRFLGRIFLQNKTRLSWDKFKVRDDLNSGTIWCVNSKWNLQQEQSRPRNRTSRMGDQSHIWLVTFLDRNQSNQGCVSNRIDDYVDEVCSKIEHVLKKWQFWSTWNFLSGAEFVCERIQVYFASQKDSSTFSGHREEKTFATKENVEFIRITQPNIPI